MSRSYKHTPVYKGDKDRFAKKMANRRIRRRSKLNPTDKKLFDIHIMSYLSGVIQKSMKSREVIWIL